jgi:hypothetical protein
MRVIALEIPDEPSELPAWLERQLVGSRLGRLVAELEAVHGVDDRGDRLDDLLGDHRDAVRQRGLAALPREAIGALLRRPRLLLELQERMLLSGGAHWQRLVEASPDLDAIVGPRRRRLAAITRGPRSPALAWRRRPWVVSLATAASVLAAVAIYETARTPPTGWGWNAPRALADEGGATAHLNRLADAASEWFQTRPADAQALAQRIGEFRQGCSALILAKHRALNDADRAWLVAKCREWAATLDAELVALEAGADPIKLRGDVDETIRRLIAAIRARAISHGESNV